MYYKKVFYERLCVINFSAISKFTFRHETRALSSLEQFADKFYPTFNYKEIRKLLPKIDYIDEYETHQGVVLKGKASRYRNPDEVASWLKKKLGIDAEIDVGGALNPLSSAGKPNVYILNGKNITHSKVIAEIHNYFGD